MAVAALRWLVPAAAAVATVRRAAAVGRLAGSAARSLAASASAASVTATPSTATPAVNAFPHNDDLRAVRLTAGQRAVAAVGAAVTAFMDPGRGDMVALLGELTGEGALQRLRDKLTNSEEGRALLATRPRITMDTVLTGRLAALPADTFGGAYARYMSVHGFSPDGRSRARAVADDELRWVLQRYREVHDFWHVLVGLPPSVLGEIAVKWFEMVQTGLPSPALAALVAPLRLPADQRTALRTLYAPWAARAGRAAPFLLAVRYEDLFERRLDDVRALLHIEPAPPLPAHLVAGAAPVVTAAATATAAPALAPQLLQLDATA